MKFDCASAGRLSTAIWCQKAITKSRIRNCVMFAFHEHRRRSLTSYGMDHHQGFVATAEEVPR